VQVFFRDGTHTDKVAVEYPIGHRRRRTEGIPVLHQKAEAAFLAHYGAEKTGKLMSLFADRVKLEAMPVHEFSAAFASPAG
jgi:2-methylcitrate dehydratase PrpD